MTYRVPKDRVKHIFWLPADISERLHRLTEKPGSSMTQIALDALRLFLDRGADNEVDTYYAVRLDRQTRAIERVQREVVFIAEALNTFVQYQLTLVAHHPPFDSETANLGQMRHQAFLDLVGRRVARAQTRTGRDAGADSGAKPEQNGNLMPE